MYLKILNCSEIIYLCANSSFSTYYLLVVKMFYIKDNCLYIPFQNKLQHKRVPNFFFHKIDKGYHVVRTETILLVNVNKITFLMKLHLSEITIL
jgi:hypothetical protein